MALIALLLFIPYFRQIRRIKAFDLGAEIDGEEVREIAEDIDEAVGHVPISTTADDPYTTYYVLAGQDPVLAIAKLRIDIEARLRERLGADGPRFLGGITQLVRKLEQEHRLPEGVASAIRPLVDAMNRAIHGVEIDDDASAEMVDSGVQFLRYLDADRALHLGRRVALFAQLLGSSFQTSAAPRISCGARYRCRLLVGFW